MRIDSEIRAFMQQHGIVVGATDFIDEHWKRDFGFAADAMPQLGLDAQSATITAASGGVPAFLSTIVDPQIVRILTAPTRAAEIYGETKRGDWTTTAVEFPIVESTGFTTSYGDWNNGGNVGANVNFMPRQPYLFQTIAQWGEHELARYGLAGINYASEMDIAAALTITKFMNKSYFYGISGLMNYGAINDPNLVSPISPILKVAGGYLWTNATAQEIFNDINALFGQLVTQMGGLVVDSNTPMTLVMPSTLVPLMNKVSTFNVSAKQTIMETFPNLTVESPPEMATVGGNLLQLFIKIYDGVDTTYAAFTEKMRNHAVVTDLSGWKQKKSAGTIGMINRRPVAMSQMLGV